MIKKAQKQKARQVHFAALMGIRHIQKYEYNPVEQSEVWKLSSPDERAVHEFPEKVNEAGMSADNLNWDNH